jgi:chemotaxis protein histidine kinase CheA/ActR/RegA family two-component response regulator
MKEILKNLVESMALPEDTYLEQDAEIIEIFVEEIEEIFDELKTLFIQWLTNPNEKELLTTIRRHFHTLKGSGRMVGAKQAGEIAWTVEDTLNRVISGSIPLSPTIQAYAKTVVNVYQHKLAPCFKENKAMTVDLRPVILLGQKLQAQQSVEPALEELLHLAVTLTEESDITGLEFTNENSELIEPVEEYLESGIAFDQHLEIIVDENLAALDETVAIFIEEAEDHLKTIDTFIEQENSQNYNKLIRAIHTLRGSSSMAQIDEIFEASTKLENLYKTLLQDDLESTDKETSLLTQYSEFVRDYLHFLRQADQSQFKRIYETFNHAWENYGFSVADAEEHLQGQGIVTRLIELNIDALLDAEFEFEKRAVSEHPTYIKQLSQQAAQLVANTDNRAAHGIHEFTHELQQAYEILIKKPVLLHHNYAFELFGQAHQEFIHLFDTLAAGERVILGEETHKLLSDLSAFVQQDIQDVAEDDTVEEVVQDTVLEPAKLVEEQSVVAGQFEASAIDFASLSKQLGQDQLQRESTDSNRDFDPDLLDIFLEEADELLAGIDEDLNTWNQDPSNTKSLNNLMRYLHTLKGGANMIQATNIGLISHELESIYERVIRKQIQATPNLIQIIRLVQDSVSDRIQSIRDDGVDYPATQAIEILKNIQSLAQGATTVPTPPVLDNSSVQEDAEFETQYPELKQSVEFTFDDVEKIDTASLDLSVSEIVEETTIEELIAETQPTLEHSAKPTAAFEEKDEMQVVMEETFYEEAEEILENAQQWLMQWFDQRSDRSLLLQLQRAAHSLKGGARMIHNEPVATIAYKLESAFEQFAVHHFNSNVYDGLLQTTFQWLKTAIFEQDLTNFDPLRHSLESISFVDVNAQLPTRATKTISTEVTANFEFIQGDGAEPPSMLGEWKDTTASDNNNEMIRISADLVEKMIDLSGENAINRSRIEMDLGQLGNTLNEMELAIKRLADQLRRMEGELESQIIAKHGSENSRYADFDPLEMDQYSSLNQLSKSLAESASDLVDFKSTLSEKIRDTEGLLLQQSRIQAEIQESLMRTRLVPFSRLLPRLQRIVRQTSTTLNRPAELVVQNTEGELDRTILERLITPFEHMLRNAVDHGLEDVEQRIQLGKPEVGQIVLNISRQGTDVIVTFTDDGKGIDESKIKEKALNQGLITEQQILDKQAILQLIFHPGFSTAAAVTQISGRGVGLDVVLSEIKALGGHVSVDSQLGKGTTFTIRVPTTVSVSDALMVKVGDQQFAVSLAQIERIVRISPTALEGYFNSNQDYFKIDNEQYKLRYLSEFVTNTPVPRLNNQGMSLPVLLIKGSTGQTVALLVDQLVGSRAQIVVKPIGQQFASIGAVTGATILGDGQVCLILDGQNLARQIQSTQRIKHVSDTRDSLRQTNTRRLVMIVDDSVTVRKVTSRLLERQGYDVVMAKDGVDAIEQLENVRPDLMLLDIEMPRMDGFEVTNLVRHHEVHRDLPIIMITSRTGEKHRERAFSLGVTHYMGKPFQEAELLANIEELIAEKMG